MSKEIENKIGQLQYEMRLLGLDQEELTGVTIRTDELKDLVKNLSIPVVIVPKGTLGCDCPFADHCIYQKDKCEAPIEYGCGYKQPNAL